jgi:hypothetical protein
MPSSLIKVNRRFGETCRLHLYKWKLYTSDTVRSPCFELSTIT